EMQAAEPAVIADDRRHHRRSAVDDPRIPAAVIVIGHIVDAAQACAGRPLETAHGQVVVGSACAWPIDRTEPDFKQHAALTLAEAVRFALALLEPFLPICLAPACLDRIELARAAEVVDRLEEFEVLDLLHQLDDVAAVAADGANPMLGRGLETG